MEKLVLAIRELDSGEGLEFSLHGCGLSLQISQWFLSRDRHLVGDLCARLTESLPSLAVELGRLIPLPIQSALGAFPAGLPLSLETASRWPWEFAELAHGRLHEHFACSRGVAQVDLPEQEFYPRVSALLVRDGAGPTRAEEAASRALREHVDLADSGDPFGGHHGLVHYSLSATPRFDDQEDSSRASFAPTFVFLNLTQPSGELLEPALSLAESLLVRGVRCVVVTAWPGHPGLLADGVARFYATLTSEGTVAQAVEAFRAAGEDPARTAWSLLALGDCSLTLPQMQPRTIRSALAQTTISAFERANFLLRVTAGPDEGREIPLFARALASGRPVTLGRSGPRRCDIELDDEELDNVVLRLEMKDGQLQLVNLTSRPASVLVNGLPVPTAVDVKIGDQVALGRSAVRLESPEQALASPIPPEPEEPVTGRYQLEVLAGVEADRGALFSLDAPISLLGRLDECAVRLHDPSVSRRHATVVLRGHSHFVSPAGEARVILNSVPIDGERRLAHDDRLELSSKTMLRFLDRRREAHS